MGAVAGLEVGLPRRIDDVDPSWMTEVLRACGAIAAPTSVTTMTTEPFAVGGGLLSLLYRATLAYDAADDADGVPATVIVKFPIDHPVQRNIADSLCFYQREIRFYREVAERSGLRTPVVHAAIMADDSTDFVVVMEDLSDRGGADQRVGATWEQALAAVDGMAALHARWHESPELPALADTFLPLYSPLYLHALPQIFDSGWPHSLSHAGDLLPEPIRRFGDRYLELLPWMLQRMSTPVTLAHGDWRLDNLFFDGGPVTVIDFQLMGQGSGAYDLGYFVSQSITPEVRRGREDELIDRYLAALRANGVERDRDELVHQVKVVVALCLIYGVSSFESYPQLPPRAQDLLRVFLGRSVAAIVDLDALAELPL